MDPLILILIAVAAAAAGGGIGVVVARSGVKKSNDTAEAEARKIREQARAEAEEIRKEAAKKGKEDGLAKLDIERKAKQLEDKEFWRNKKAEHEKMVAEKGLELEKRQSQVVQLEQQNKNREKELAKQQEQVHRKETELEATSERLKNELEKVARRKEEIEALRQEQVEKLEKVANLTADQAREQIIEALRQEATLKASSYVKDIVEEARLTATKEARKVVLDTIQRTATEHAVENCVSVFNIESDEIKGKIIGREGRNIRTLEAATGVEIIVDDTPEAIIISGFDPVRREICRLSLHRLVQDGRIHPARIEEVVNKTRKDIENEIVEIGEKTAIDLGIHGLHPELIRMVGRMRYRSSYGQNLLQHSREVAKMAATMASELGLNAKLAKRAGLLHDIGKVWPEEPELPHALLGMELAQKYKEHPEVCNAIGAHHDEIEMTSLISPIVQACDAISGARPGARREVTESYLKRLRDLEQLSSSFEGVTQSFAIQAGRELRIIVDAERVTDESSSMLAFQISQKIEKEMQYPGQIKVTVIREMRSVAYAK